MKYRAPYHPLNASKQSPYHPRKHKIHGDSPLYGLFVDKAFLVWLTRKRGISNALSLEVRLSKNVISIKALTVILKPTGTYHLEIAYWLYVQSATIRIANSKDVHFFAKSLGRESKTNRLDLFCIGTVWLDSKN